MATKSQQLQIRVSAEQKTALKELARLAGIDLSSYVLARALPPVTARWRDAVAALRAAGDNRQQRRLALAELNDLLSGLTASQLHHIAADAALDGLTPFAANYLAAMVEQAAERRGTSPPAWVRDVPPLDRPYFAAPFARLRPYLLRAAPVAFKRRNLFIDASLGDRV